MGSGPHRAPAKQTVDSPDWDRIRKDNDRLQGKLKEFLDAATPAGVKAALSVEMTLLAQELRTDWGYGAGKKPL